MFKFLFQSVAVSIIQWLASFVFLFFFVLTRFNYFFAAKSKIFTNLFTATSTSKCLKSVLTKSEISPSRSHSEDCRANRNFSLGSRDHLNCLRRVTSSCRSPKVSLMDCRRSLSSRLVDSNPKKMKVDEQ